ncbi:DNA adenine methylase [Methylobacterium sp. DB1607]|nr:DNA adenine methylase [Methylobacterium sp. DB1607]
MRYPGGKGRAYPRIINAMPPHRTYIETHLGGGAVLRRKRPAERSIGIERDPRVVERWRADPVPGVEIIEGDALDFLRRFTFSGDELIYCDPPYLRETRRRARCYAYDYDDDEHVALLSVLVTLPCAVMISGYPSQLYSEMLEGWREIPMAVASHVGLRSETIWMNFAPPDRLHDHRFLGNDFRRREAIRRRVERWLLRLERMKPAERNAVLAALNEKFGSAAPSCSRSDGAERPNGA